MSFYFEQFENRRPPAPLKTSRLVESLAQICLIIAIVTGAWYIHWRWTSSINYDALWIAIPLILAETGAYIGLVLFVFTIWRVDDYEKKPAPACVTECHSGENRPPRPVSVDVFFPTYDEEVDLVRLSLEDAGRIRYPHPINIKIHVLDDGNRPQMRALAEEMGCNYITRDNNIGFKAGNMRNAMEQTSGDFILICDADTRPFPTILENTLGYFRDPDVAWVQTPQWFFDLPEGKRLPVILKKKLGRHGERFGRLVEKCVGPVKVGEDPFVNDPKLFYDVILRRRNWASASFCCGAGSIHRREAVMQVALRQFSLAVDKMAQDQSKELKRFTGEEVADDEVMHLITQKIAHEKEFTPYKFHVSEDIYTSIELHSDTKRKWKSVLHPDVESKMLSPQDLLTWTVQRFKYAGGTLDIGLNDDFLFRRGLSFPQRMMYASTVWSYLGGVWNVIFLTAPLVYLFLAIAPVSAYSVDFYKHIFPFLFMTELGTMLAMWGISGRKAKFSYLSFFPVNIKAIWTVLRGEKISFPVTSKVRQDGNFLRVVWPQASIIVITLIGIVYAWTLLFSGHPRMDLSGLLINTFWSLNNILALSGIV
ncbi:MAG: glycosyltransferase [Gammaproteobacteria bacterium]|nr:glycosyltransferase [Gammaproteobacteria bacterium]